MVTGKNRIIGLIAAAVMLLTVSCQKGEDTIEYVSQRRWVSHTVAVVAPLGEAATRARLERTAQWFLENFKEAQMNDTLAIDLKIEWYDELSVNLKDLSYDLSYREDIDAIIGPFGNEAIADFAPACKRTEKPLIAPTATSDEIVRRFAVPSSTGQQTSNPFFWALTESDIKLVETLLAVHATLMRQLQLDTDGNASAILLSPDDSYGQTFNYWAPFFAQNYNLDLVYNDLYSDNADLTEQLDASLQENVERMSTVATLCVAETKEELLIAARAHRAAAMKLQQIDMQDMDPEGDMANQMWQVFSYFYRPYFILPSISDEGILSLGDRGRKLLQGYQGYSPYANPATGFELAYQTRFDNKPTFAECKLYDALMLASFAICYAEHQGLESPENRNRQINESIIKITAPAADVGKLSGATWNSTVMGFYLRSMEDGNLLHFTGAASDITFDTENYTPTTHTTYVLWQIFDGEIVHKAYFGGGGTHTADASAAWNFLYSHEQASRDFESYASGDCTIVYAPLTNQYAVLVQGSSEWTNYRHQADVLSVYQLLRKGGFDDDHIIMVLDKAIPTYAQNNEYGIIRSRVGGKDLLSGSDGLPKAVVDYDAVTLTAADIADILTGRQSDELPVVLPADAGANVLFYWSGHGRSQANGRSDEFVWRDRTAGNGFTQDMMKEAATQMLNEGRCRKLLVIAEPCYGEATARGIEGIDGALAITGASAREQSWADNWNNESLVWMSDRFTQNVVDFLTENPQANYHDLFLHCAQHTLGSHTRIINAAHFGNLYGETLNEFFNNQNK